MKKIFNILNGDCLAEQLKETSVSGEVIVCREALVVGDLQAENLQDLWKKRSEFISVEYKAEENEYQQKSVSEFEKILNIPNDSEVHLWFEDDLFCQVNFWFCVYILSTNKTLKLYRIFPNTSENDHWKGFSVSSASDLEEALDSKILMNQRDINLMINLWKSFQNKDKIRLEKLSYNSTKSLRNLDYVIKVYLEKEYEKFIINLMERGIIDFDLIYAEFTQNFGMLGFGDLQVKALLKKAL